MIKKRKNSIIFHQLIRNFFSEWKTRDGEIFVEYATDEIQRSNVNTNNFEK